MPLRPRSGEAARSASWWPNWKFGTVNVRSTAAVQGYGTITAAATTTPERRLLDVIFSPTRRAVGSIPWLSCSSVASWSVLVFAGHGCERVAGLDGVGLDLHVMDVPVGLLLRRRGHGRSVRPGVVLALMEPGADDERADSDCSEETRSELPARDAVPIHVQPATREPCVARRRAARPRPLQLPASPLPGPRRARNAKPRRARPPARPRTPRQVPWPALPGRRRRAGGAPTRGRSFPRLGRPAT